MLPETVYWGIRQNNTGFHSTSILKQNIFELRKLYDEVNNEVVQKLLKDIIKISDKIYKEVVVNTDKLYKLDRFNNYYLITIQKIVKNLKPPFQIAFIVL